MASWNGHGRWRKVLALGCLAAAFAATASADTVVTRQTRVTTLAPGVHTIRHADPTDDFPDGNTTVVIGSRAVLVVDTGYLPSTARADIERIRAWTSLPVRWVVNTHWHNDHVGGNHSYLQAYPGAEIVGHRELRPMTDLRLRSYVRRFIDESSVFGQQRSALRSRLQSGLDDKGQALDAAAQSAARESLQRYERAVAEFRDFVVQPPTVSYEQRMRIDLGEREVELWAPGRGHTAGDTVVWLPQERILVAGDLVAHPVPYAFGGYPSDWVGTLGRLAALKPAAIVPGHGEVLRDAAYLRRVIALLERVIARVNQLVGERGSGLTLEQAQAEVDFTAARREFAGDDADNKEFFDASMASLVRLVWAEAKAR
jgi:cyclase